MPNKLFVLTAGTVAAGVAQEFYRQIHMRNQNELSYLQTMIRCIDTANLADSGFLEGEWFPLSIDNQFMDGINAEPEKHYPELKGFLYPGRLPETTSDGGGGFRYNGAGSVILNREKIQKWLKDSMVDLASMGDGNPSFSIALLVSAVGATGSGTLERLIEIVINAARTANPNEDPHCNVFILQPGTQKVTDLGLANTVALYAEMAASRLAHTNTSIRRYKGRTILVGWGTGRLLDSLQHLQEAAATLVRLISDPISEIAAEYRQRAVDNHMLLDPDPFTHLPSHLSSATAVTIGIGDLKEQITQRDATRLLQGLVYGESASNGPQEQVSVLQSAITGFLNGENDTSRYEHLLERISEGITLNCEAITVPQLRKMPANQRASSLESDWLADKDILAQQGRSLMEKQGRELAKQAVADMTNGRRMGMATGHALTNIRADYEKMQALVKSVQRVAQGYIPPEADSDEVVHDKLKKLAHPGWFRGSRALEDALASVQDALRSQRKREANQVANQVLLAMAAHCVVALRDLNVVIQKTPKLTSKAQSKVTDEPQWRVATDHLLHMSALKPEEVDNYYRKVSIFNTHPDDEKSAVYASFLDDDKDQQIDALSDFRRQLEQIGRLDVLFSGDFNAIAQIVQNYVHERIHAHMAHHSVIDVLLEAGENVLYERLNEAAAKACSLVSFSSQIAKKCREVRHVSVCCNEVQRGKIQKIIEKTFRQGECTLVKSKDPTEIVVFYYVDGLSMSAVKDLTGRCLDEFLKRRMDWHNQVKAQEEAANTNENASLSSVQGISVPIYSGRDAEDLVRRTGVIRRLYQFRDQSIINRAYTSEDVPELGPYAPTWVHLETKQPGTEEKNGHAKAPTESQAQFHSTGGESNHAAANGSNVQAHMINND